MASRNGGEIRNVKNFSSEEVELHNYTLFSLFQYMIINNDWSISQLHNIKLLSIDPSMSPITVPYDFDWAGMVCAPYRITADGGKDFMSDRDYHGVCRMKNDLKFYFDYLKSKSVEIYDLYRNFDLLDRKHKAIALKILDDFYEILNYQDSWKDEFFQVCRLDKGKGRSTFTRITVD